MTTQTAVPAFLPFDFVYAGRRALKGDKPGAEIFRVVDGRLADSFVFASKSLKSARTKSGFTSDCPGRAAEVSTKG